MYYRILDDMSGRDRWYLGSPRDAAGSEVDPRRFTAGSPVEPPGALRVPVRQPGPAREFTLADFGMPVVSPQLGAHLEALAPAAVQRFLVEVEGAGTHEVLNVTCSVRCLDEAASGITRWTEADGRPDKVGQYRMVVRPVIDPALAGDTPLFRLGGWPVMLVCAAAVHDALAGRYTGLAFEPLGTTDRVAAV